MSRSAFSPYRVGAVLSAVATAVSVAGCGRTLVFAEREGVNFAVRANPSATPPLGVNFGLERVVATVVPPASQQDGKPGGEGVNMFAAFQIDSTGINLPKSPDVPGGSTSICRSTPSSHPAPPPRRSPATHPSLPRSSISGPFSRSEKTQTARGSMPFCSSPRRRSSIRTTGSRSKLQ